MEGERERVGMKRICLDRLSSKVFDVLCPDSEVESVGDSVGFSMCVPVVPPSVIECESGLWGCFLCFGS